MIPALLLSLVGCIPDLPVLGDPCAAFPDGGGLYRVAVDEPDARTRHPYVYVPAGEGPRDVVYLLHGRGSNGPAMAEITGYLDEADLRNVVIVYANGLGFPREWNAGPQFGQGQDDVAFLEDLAAEVTPQVCGRRQLAVGFSNGMMMAHRWACEGTVLDAIGGSSGPLMTKTCVGDPVPVRQYQGDADTIVPLDGGISYGIRVPPLSDTMAIWRERNGCTDDPPTVTTTGDTTCTAWRCEVPTEQCVIAGWGHLWPGGSNTVRTDADATDALLQFFRTAVPLADDDPPLTDTGAP